jgi:hypothetical protein
MVFTSAQEGKLFFQIQEPGWFCSILHQPYQPNSGAQYLLNE